MTTLNHQLRLRRRPVGRVTRDDFEWREAPLPELREGEALVRTRLLSLDPTHRIWMSDKKQYMPPVALGDVMRGGGLAEVVASERADLRAGDWVSTMTGWQEYAVVGAKGAAFKLPDLPGVRKEAFLGVAGMTGMTAYFGLLDVGQAKAGETVVVSAAAGAVGHVVGQIAKLQGCRAVGIAGGDEKCSWLRDELKFDAAVDYKANTWEQQLADACPDGIDVNFENVGGHIMERVLHTMNLRGRVVLCGLIAGYNDTEPLRVDISQALMQRLRVEGFIILDYAKRFAEAAAQLGQWVAEGKLKTRETVVEGLNFAPEALNMLFDGGNIGKLMVRV